MLVGEQFSAYHQADPLVGRCTRWLATMAGVDHATLLKATDRRNLMPGVGKSWNHPAQHARVHAYELAKVMRLESHRGVVLLGRRVQAAFADRIGWTRPDAGRDMAMGLVGSINRIPVWHCPHPSGRCRWWNDADNRARAYVILGTIF